jgi:hypothetical protein
MKTMKRIRNTKRILSVKLERIIAYLDRIRTSPEVTDNPDNTEWESLDEAIELCIALQDDCVECDCGESGDMGRHEYRYFNPSFNYVSKDGKPTDGLTPEEVRKYVRQDYDRMESLNSGNWCYLGIRADAEIVSVYGRKSTLSDTVTTGGYGPVQTIRSGGLWGIESDSDKSYFAEVAQEELSALRTELKAIGFSTRAISKAFKSVEEVQS